MLMYTTEWYIFSQVNKRGCLSTPVLNESITVVSKAQECLNFSLVGWYCPLGHAVKCGCIHLNWTAIDDVT